MDRYLWKIKIIADVVIGAAENPAMVFLEQNQNLVRIINLPNGFAQKNAFTNIQIVLHGKETGALKLDVKR